MALIRASGKRDTHTHTPQFDIKYMSVNGSETDLHNLAFPSH